MSENGEGLIGVTVTVKEVPVKAQFPMLTRFKIIDLDR